MDMSFSENFGLKTGMYMVNLNSQANLFYENGFEGVGTQSDWGVLLAHYVKWSLKSKGQSSSYAL